MRRGLTAICTDQTTAHYFFYLCAPQATNIMRKQLLTITLLLFAVLLGRAQNEHYTITILPPDTNWGKNSGTTFFSNAYQSWRGTLYWNDLLYNPLGDCPREWFHVVEYQGDFYLSKYYPYSTIFTDSVIIYNGMDWGFSAFADFKQDKDFSYQFTAFQTRPDSTVAAYHPFITQVPGHEGLYLFHKDNGDEYELVTNRHYLKNFKILDEHFDENGDWEFRPPYYPQPDLDDLFSSRPPLDTTTIVVTPQLAQTMRKVKVSRKRPLTDFYFWPNGTALYCKHNKCGVIKYSGEVIIPSEYQRISLHEDLFILSKNCKKKQPIPICSEGLADKNGEILIPCNPDIITFYIEDSIVTVLQHAKDTVADVLYYNTQTKEFCAKPTYDNFPGFHINRNYSEKDSLFDGDGNLILSDYDAIIFTDGIAVVLLDTLYGTVNQNGKTLLPCIYDDIWVKDDILTVKKDGKVAFADFNGEFITPFMENTGNLYAHSGLIVTSQRSADGSRLLKGVINSRGKVIVPCQYDDIEIFPDVILLKKDGKYGFCDREGNIIAPCIYEFCENLWCICAYATPPASIEGKWGLINRQNEVLIPFEWDGIEPYGNLALVQKDGLWGGVNFEQDTVIPIQYDEIITNPIGLYAVVKDGKMGIIDTLGHIIVPCIYEYDEYNFWLWGGVDYTDNLLITLKKGEKFGAVNTNGEVVIPFVYDELGFFFGEDIQMVPARKGRRIGYVDRFGNSTFAR